MTILLIEDDEKVGNFLKEHLGKGNHKVHLLTTFKEVEDFLEAPMFTPSLFIMDRLLGNDDTKKIITKIKLIFKTSSILVLSALNTPAEKANLLDEGADDYMGKPFSLVELQARVKALLRRNPESSNTASLYIQISDVIIDLKSRNVLCNGTKLDFTPKEFSLLLNFCEQKNRVFSKHQLLDIIWETNLDIESNVIEVNIMNIRKKLEVCNSLVKIQSKRNVGYWLET
jgi:two-component system, OmpR family, response regulator